MNTDRLGIKVLTSSDPADYKDLNEAHQKTDAFAKEIGIETEFDTRNIDITRTNGKISQVAFKAQDGTAVLKTITVNRVNGKVASIQTVHNNKTITETVQRGTDGKITGITKQVT